MERIALIQIEDIARQCFPNCRVDKNYLGCLLKYSFLGSCLGDSDSVDLGWAQKYVFLTSTSDDSYRQSLRKLVLKKRFRLETRNRA